jgi:hypothetical protein
VDQAFSPIELPRVLIVSRVIDEITGGALFDAVTDTEWAAIENRASRQLERYSRGEFETSDIHVLSPDRTVNGTSVPDAT